MTRFRRTLAIGLLVTALLPACAVLREEPKLRFDARQYAARLQLAQLTADSGDVPSARGIFETLIKEEPTRPDGWLGLGNLYLRSGDLVNAEANFLNASRTSPEDVRPLAGLGRTALTRLEIETALRWLDEALLVDPHDIESRNARAVALDLAGRHGEAQSIYEAILLEEPAELRARNNFALSLMLGGDAGPGRRVAWRTEPSRERRRCLCHQSGPHLRRWRRGLNRPNPCFCRNWTSIRRSRICAWWRH